MSFLDKNNEKGFNQLLLNDDISELIQKIENNPNLISKIIYQKNNLIGPIHFSNLTRTLTIFDFLLLTVETEKFIRLIKNLPENEIVKISKINSFFYAKNLQPVSFQYSNNAHWLFNKFWQEKIWPKNNLGEIIWFAASDFTWLQELIKSDYFTQSLNSENNFEVIHDISQLICHNKHNKLISLFDQDIIFKIPPKNYLTFIDWAIYEENISLLSFIAELNKDRFINFIEKREIALSKDYIKLLNINNLNLSFILGLCTPGVSNTINRVVNNFTGEILNWHTLSLLSNKVNSFQYLNDFKNRFILNEEIINKHVYFLNNEAYSLYEEYLIDQVNQGSQGDLQKI